MVSFGTDISVADIKKAIADYGISLINLYFVDLLGYQKCVTVPVEAIDAVVDGEAMFDGSSISGLVDIEKSDMFLMPDLKTFRVLSSPADPIHYASFLCDIYGRDGKPFVGCPRGNLKRLLAEIGKDGYTFNTGVEAEFFLMPLRDGKIVPQPADEAGYGSNSPIDKCETVRNEIVLALKQAGIMTETSRHEVGPAQNEINWQYADAVTTGDNLVMFKHIVRTIANRHGLHASFLPKPFFGVNGSGMHTHMSLVKDGKNVFYAADGAAHLSETARYFLAGVLKYAGEMTAVNNPIINSYKRLVPGYEAPVYIAWSECNRSALVRIPAIRKSAACRIELRSPDATCNPYLSAAVILQAGLAGIREKLTLPAPVDENIYHMSEAEREARGIGSLPGSLEEAIRLMKRSELVKSAIGSYAFEHYIALKEKEWDEYRKQVHAWELDRYLKVC